MSLFSYRDMILKEIEEDNKSSYPKRDKYYRFRLSSKEKKQLEENKKKLKEYDLTLADVVRHLSLNCVDFDMLYDLGLITHYDKKSNKKIIKYKLRSK